MELRPQIVQFALAQVGVATVLSGDAACPVERVRLLRSRALLPGTLYVTSGKLPRNVPTSSGACLLAAQDGGVDATELLEHVCDVVQQLQEWDARLKAALADEIALGDYVQLGDGVIPYVFGFYDRDLTPLGASSNFASYTPAATDGAVWPEDVGSGRFPDDYHVDLFEDDDFIAAERYTQPFYFDMNAGPVRLRSYCLNAIDGDEYVARLVITLPPGSDAMHPGAELLAQHFFRHLDERFKRYTGSEASQAGRSDPLHRLLRNVLFDKQPLEPNRMAAVLSTRGWQRAQRFALVKFVFFESVQWDSAALFICRQLEHRWHDTCAVYTSRAIAWLVRLDAGAEAETEAAMHATITALSQTYACKAGMSGVFGDFADVPIAYVQAEAALAIGATRNPHYWYYRFEDCKFDYLLSRCTQELSAVQVASGKVLALAEADRESGSEYVRTLRVFLEENQNATHAAERLFIHRTSLLRRLQRMDELAGLDLEDPDEVLFLALSLKPLDR